jgi:[protein-PII] uridylyltransferase
MASGELPLPRISKPMLSNPREDAMPVNASVRLMDGDDPYHSVLDVQCRDRRGLMYDFARVFEKLGLNVTYALATTDGPVARDVFHLQDIFGGRVEGQDKIKALLEQVSRVGQVHRSEYDSSRSRPEVSSTDRNELST